MARFRFLGLILTMLSVNAMAQLSADSWRDHLSYRDGRIVAVSDSKVYCATDLSLFYLDKDDHSLNHLSPIEGMTETGAGYIAYCDKLHLLVVAYNSGNIDLVYDNGKIINLSGLKDAQFTTDKRTNHICIDGHMAYLSCNFGITAVNLEKREFADTYILGKGGNLLKINCTAVCGDYLYAFTNSGLLRGRLDNPFLSDLKNWELVPGCNLTHFYNTGCVFNGQLIVGERFADDSTSQVSVFEGKELTILWDSLPMLKSLTSRGDYLVRTTNAGIDMFDTKMNCVNQKANNAMQMGIADGSNKIWFAHSDGGMGCCNNGQLEFYIPSGPAHNRFFKISYNAGDILLAPGGKKDIGTGENKWLPANIYRFTDGQWTSISYSEYPEIAKCFDVCDFITHGNRNHFLASAWFSGLIEYNNGTYRYIDTATAGVNIYRVSSGCYDSKGNLWVNCSHTSNYIAVRKPDGQWFSYAYDPKLSNENLGKMLRTYKGDFWITTPKATGILVFNTNDTPETKADDYYTYFMPTDENGNAFNAFINDIVEDNNGQLWVASDEGVYVFDHPELALEGETSARRPQMIVEGYYQPLLSTERVTSIVIDGGNRKWFGTDGGGIFLISPDGTKQLAEYNTSNSPLFSNNVQSMTLDYDKGILYIITDMGLQSAIISSSMPNSTFSDIYAYPNPVEPDYQGDVQIRGLMNNTTVRITDLYGNLVFETMSNGGGATWNLRNMSNRPVVTGIYLIHCVTQNGENREAVKIHVVR